MTPDIHERITNSKPFLIGLLLSGATGIPLFIYSCGVYLKRGDNLFTGLSFAILAVMINGFVTGILGLKRLRKN